MHPKTIISDSLECGGPVLMDISHLVQHATINRLFRGFLSTFTYLLFCVFLCPRIYDAKIFIYSQLAVNAYISIEYLHLNVSIRHLYKGLKIVTESLETRARQAPLGDESAYLRDLKRSQKIWVEFFLSESPATYNGN